MVNFPSTNSSERRILIILIVQSRSVYISRFIIVVIGSFEFHLDGEPDIVVVVCPVFISGERNFWNIRIHVANEVIY